MKEGKDNQSDDELLQLFSRGGDEQAFRALVERHFNLVYSIACRESGDAELAKDVAQQVFIVLASTSNTLFGSAHLSLWLHHVTRNMARNLKKAEVRRARREAIATQLNSLRDAPASWWQIAPEIDAAISQLSILDRQIVILRFYMGHTYIEVARHLRLTTEATRKRCDRALETLGELLKKRGITTTASALASMLPAHAVGSAPAGLAATVASAALAAPPVSIATLSLHALILMKYSTKTAIIGLSVAAVLTTSILIGGKLKSSSGHTDGSQSSSSLVPDSRDGQGSLIASGNKGRASKISSRDISKTYDFSELESILSNADKEARLTLLNEYLSKLDSAGMKRAIDYIAAPGSSHIDHLDLVLHKWAGLDPDAAVSWAHKKYPGQTEGLLGNWASRDPNAARAWVDSIGKDLVGGNPYYKPILMNLPDGPDRLERATELMLSLSAADQTRSEAINSIRSFAHSMEVPTLRAWVDSLPSGLKEEASTQLILDVASRDITASLDFYRNVKTVPDQLPHMLSVAMAIAEENGMGGDLSAYIEGMSPGEEKSILEAIRNRSLTLGKRSEHTVIEEYR